jgi:hypothetical protein
VGIGEMTEHADYVDFLFQPMTYSAWWVLGGAGIALLIAAWIASAFVWTLPVEILRDIPVIRDITFRVLRGKFDRALARVEQSHRAGQLSSREAYHQVSKIFRRFVSLRTGYAVCEMTAADVANSPLADAVSPVLRITYPGQFDTADPNWVAEAVSTARKVVTAWV